MNEKLARVLFEKINGDPDKFGKFMEDLQSNADLRRNLFDRVVKGNPDKYEQFENDLLGGSTRQSDYPEPIGPEEPEPIETPTPSFPEPQEIEGAKMPTQEIRGDNLGGGLRLQQENQFAEPPEEVEDDKIPSQQVGRDNLDSVPMEQLRQPGRLANQEQDYEEPIGPDVPEGLEDLPTFEDQEEEEKPSLELVSPMNPYMPFNYKEAREKFNYRKLRNTVAEQRAAEKQADLVLEQIRMERQGNYDITEEELAARRRAENPDPNYEYEQKRAKKRKGLIERIFGSELVSKDNDTEQATVEEWKLRMGDIQEGVDKLNLGKDALERRIRKDGRGQIFDEYLEYEQDLQRLNSEYRQLRKIDPESARIQEIYEEAVEIQKKKEELVGKEPRLEEYDGMNRAIHNHKTRAQSILFSDEFESVRNTRKFAQEIQQLKDETGTSPFETAIGGPLQGFFTKTGIRLLGAVGATMDILENQPEIIGVPKPVAEAARKLGYFGDENYGWWDMTEDFLMDLDEGFEKFAPVNSALKRDFITKTGTWKDAEGNEYQVDLNDEGEIQAIRNEDGTMNYDIKPQDIPDDDLEKVIEGADEMQWNVGAGLYQGMQVVTDLLLQIAILKGLGGGLTKVLPSKMAGMTANTVAGAGLMLEPLYQEGVEMFDGDKRKAAQYATTAAGLIGAAGNLFGLETKLAGFGGGWADDLIGAFKRTKGAKNFKGLQGLTPKQAALLTARALGKESLGEAAEESVLEPMIQSAVAGALGENPEPWGMDEYREFVGTAVLSGISGLFGAFGTVGPELAMRNNELYQEAALLAMEDLTNFSSQLRNQIDNGVLKTKFKTDKQKEDFIQGHLNILKVMDAQLKAHDVGDDVELKKKLMPTLLERQQLAVELKQAQDPETGSDEARERVKEKIEKNRERVKQIKSEHAKEKKRPKTKEPEASEVFNVQSQPTDTAAETQAAQGDTQRSGESEGQGQEGQEATQVAEELFVPYDQLPNRTKVTLKNKDPQTGEVSETTLTAKAAHRLLRKSMDEIELLKQC